MSAARRVTWTGLALAALAGGCGGSLPGPCEDGGCGTQISWRKAYQVASEYRKLDVLFVVDDTSAIAAHAGEIASGFADTARMLLEPWYVTADHVGFVRAGGCDASTRGLACGVAPPEQFLRSEWCHTTTNFSGAFVDTFACMADFGASNCAPAQPLSAALRALSGLSGAGWKGFLRPDARLLLVFIAAEDDTSATPVADVAAAARALKPEPYQVHVSVVVPGVCADETPRAPRLLDLASAFGANGLYVPMCTGAELPLAFLRASAILGQGLLPPCAPKVRDIDPETPGLQADCNVQDIAIAPDGSQTISALPNCDRSAPPCWRLASPASPGCDGYAFYVDREPTWCGEAGMNGILECLTCADPNDPACAVAL